MPAAGMIAFIGSQSYTVCFRGQAFKPQDSERAYRSIVELYSERSQLLHLRKVLRPLHARSGSGMKRSEEHTSELQSRENLVCRLLLEKKKKTAISSRSEGSQALLPGS